MLQRIIKFSENPASPKRGQIYCLRRVAPIGGTHLASFSVRGTPVRPSGHRPRGQCRRKKCSIPRHGNSPFPGPDAGGGIVGGRVGAVKGLDKSGFRGTMLGAQARSGSGGALYPSFRDEARAFSLTRTCLRPHRPSSHQQTDSVALARWLTLDVRPVGPNAHRFHLVCSGWLSAGGPRCGGRDARGRGETTGVRELTGAGSARAWLAACRTMGLLPGSLRARLGCCASQDPAKAVMTDGGSVCSAWAAARRF